MIIKACVIPGCKGVACYGWGLLSWKAKPLWACGVHRGEIHSGGVTEMVPSPQPRPDRPSAPAQGVLL